MNGSVNYVFMKCRLPALEMRSSTAGNMLFPLWYHTPRAYHPSTKAEGLCAVLASYPENDQEIKTSLLSLGKLGTKSETVSSEMQARWERRALSSAADRSPCGHSRGNPHTMTLHRVLCLPPGTVGKPSPAALAASR